MKTLRTRLLLAVFLVQAGGLLLLLWTSQAKLAGLLADEVHMRAETIEQAIGAAVAPQLAVRDLAALRETVRESASALGLEYLAASDTDGTLLAGAGQLPGAAVQVYHPASLQLQPEAGTFHFASEIKLAGQRYGRLDFGVPAKRYLAAEQALLQRTLLIGAVVLALSLAMLALLTRVLTRGLAELGDAAQRVGAGELTLRVPVRDSADIGRVAQAFNHMSEALAERVAALQEAEARQRTLVEALAEGVVFQDAGDKVLACNDAATRVLGLTRNQLLGLDSMDPRWRAIHRDGSAFDFSQHPSVLALRSGQPQRGVLMGVHRPDGTRAWISINSEPLRLAGADQPHATVTSFSDITALIDTEERLQQLNASLEQRVSERTGALAAARDEAERASAAKSEFLSRMSHELRTPLNAILGFAQLLQLQPAALPAASRAHVLQIETAGWHLLTLINEVLDLSRIESGAMVVELAPVDAGSLAIECVRMLEPLAAQSNIAVRLDLATAPLAVEADRLRLHQVLTNLLSNAVKYNRAGGQVTVSTRALGADRVQIKVSDTGQGFTPAQIEQLYQPFNRLGAEERGTPGTGIGLNIARRLLELMGGSLELSTVAGAGSTFTVSLPRAGHAPAAAATTRAAAPTGPAGASHELLYIEDNPSNATLLSAVVRLRPDLHLTVVANGTSGLAHARAHRPQLIVVDIDLPDISGTAVCQALRADAALARTPLIALSAKAMDHDVATAMLAGFDAYLTKPLEVAAFLATVDRLLQSQR